MYVCLSMHHFSNRLLHTKVKKTPSNKMQPSCQQIVEQAETFQLNLRLIVSIPVIVWQKAMIKKGEKKRIITLIFNNYIITSCHT